MIRLVQTADANRAKVVTVADRWATVIVVLAFSIAVITYLITREMLRAVTVLCVFCPCALVLATPTAIVAAIGNVSKYGILVKAGDALERLAAVRRVTFDKTGTITYGNYRYLKYTACRIVVFLPKMYSLSRHRQNCVRSIRLEKQLYRPGRIKEIILRNPNIFCSFGTWCRSCYSGKTVYVGTPESDTEEKDIPLQTLREQGQTVVGVHVEGKLIGYIVLSDVLRDTVPQTIQALREQQLQPVLLTGDRREAAAYMANLAGITKCRRNAYRKRNWKRLKNGKRPENRFV